MITYSQADLCLCLCWFSLLFCGCMCSVVCLGISSCEYCVCVCVCYFLSQIFVVVQGPLDSTLQRWQCVCNTCTALIHDVQYSTLPLVGHLWIENTTINLDTLVCLLKHHVVISLSGLVARHCQQDVWLAWRWMSKLWKMQESTLNWMVY